MQLCIRVWCRRLALSGASQDFKYESVCHKASQCVLDAAYMLFILAKIAGMEKQENVITLSLLVPLLGVTGTCRGAKEQGLLMITLVCLPL